MAPAVVNAICNVVRVKSEWHWVLAALGDNDFIRCSAAPGKGRESKDIGNHRQPAAETPRRWRQPQRLMQRKVEVRMVSAAKHRVRS